MSANPRGIWSCKIGEVEHSGLPYGADLPMRLSVQEAYEQVTGRPSEFCFSGWAATLTDSEEAYVASLRRPIQLPQEILDAVERLESAVHDQVFAYERGHGGRSLDNERKEARSALVAVLVSALGGRPEQNEQKP